MKVYILKQWACCECEENTCSCRDNPEIVCVCSTKAIAEKQKTNNWNSYYEEYEVLSESDKE